jgi:hypothetical protein
MDEIKSATPSQERVGRQIGRRQTAPSVRGKSRQAAAFEVTVFHNFSLAETLQETNGRLLDGHLNGDKFAEVLAWGRKLSLQAVDLLLSEGDHLQFYIIHHVENEAVTDRQ